MGGGGRKERKEWRGIKPTLQIAWGRIRGRSPQLGDGFGGFLGICYDRVSQDEPLQLGMLEKEGRVGHPYGCGCGTAAGP